MAKKKNYKVIARDLKRFEERLAKRNTKVMADFFLWFRKDLEKQLGVKFAEKKVIISYERFNKKLKLVLNEIIKYNIVRTISKYSEVFKWSVSAKITKSVRDKILRDWNKKYSSKKVTRMADTTKKRLGAVIANSQDKGLSYKDTVKAILNNVNDMRIGRARTIARTETSSAINNTSNATAEEVGMDEKGWLHIGGKYTSRSNHVALNNTWIKLNELFDLGNGLKARFPHDPNLPASEVVSCNCLTIYR